VVKGMQTRFEELKQTFLEPPDLYEDSCPENFRIVVEVGASKEQKELPCGCWMAVYNYNGFDGPYQNLPSEYFYFSMETLPDMATGKALGEFTEPQPKSEQDYEHEKVDRSDEFDHPKIDHSADPNPSGNHHLEFEEHHHEEFEEHLDTVDMLAQQREHSMEVQVGHDIYLMVGIAVFMTLGLTTKYCIRSKMDKHSQSPSYDAVLP